MSYDRIQETWTGSGTGTVTLSGSAASGFRTLAGVVPDGKDFEYTILHENGTEWEVGQGVYSSSAGTLTRARVHSSSNSDALVSFTTGNKRIFGNCPAGRWILDDKTLYLSPTGNDTAGNGSSSAPWATIGRALRFLRDRWIASDATVTIQLADGQYSHTAPVEIAHPCGSRIAIVGQNSYAKTMSSVVSSSGSSGAWSLVLQLNNVSNIAVGDYVLVTAASGGTNPLFAMGCHEITNVDSGNARITVTSKAINASAPSGAVAANVTVLKARLYWSAGTAGIVCAHRNALGLLDKVAILGNSVAYSAGLCSSKGHDGTQWSAFGGEISCGASVGIANWNYGIYSNHTGQVYANSVVISGCLNGILSSMGGSVSAQSALVTGCTNGMRSHNCSCLRANSASAICCTTGFWATAYGYILAASSVVSGNGTDYSPVTNSQGNECGYIDT